MRKTKGSLKVRDRQNTSNRAAERQSESIVSRTIAVLRAPSRRIVDNVPDPLLPHDPTGRQLIEREAERYSRACGSAYRQCESTRPDPDLLIAAQAEQRKLVYRTAQGIGRPLIICRQRLWKRKRQHFRFNASLTKVQGQGVLHGLGEPGEGKKRLGDIRQMRHPCVHVTQCTEIGDASGRSDGHLSFLKIQTGESNESARVIGQRNGCLPGLVNVQRRTTIKRPEDEHIQRWEQRGLPPRQSRNISNANGVDFWWARDTTREFRQPYVSQRRSGATPSQTSNEEHTKEQPRIEMLKRG